MDDFFNIYLNLVIFIVNIVLNVKGQFDVMLIIVDVVGKVVVQWIYVFFNGSLVILVNISVYNVGVYMVNVIMVIENV